MVLGHFLQPNPKKLNSISCLTKCQTWEHVTSPTPTICQPQGPTPIRSKNMPNPGCTWLCHALPPIPEHPEASNKYAQISTCLFNSIQSISIYITHFNSVYLLIYIKFIVIYLAVQLKIILHKRDANNQGCLPAVLEPGNTKKHETT